MRSKRYSGIPIHKAATCVCWIVALPLLVAGCATPGPVSLQTPPVPLVPAASMTKRGETPYAVRGYHDATNPSVRHEPHTIFRSTRVPVTAADELPTAPRTAHAPATLAPLPPSAELAAEIGTQKKITEELRALQGSMAEAESRMQAQYALLVRQSSEALKVRQQLEEERERVRVASSAAGPATAERATTAKSTEAKW